MLSSFILSQRCCDSVLIFCTTPGCLVRQYISFFSRSGILLIEYITIFSGGQNYIVLPLRTTHQSGKREELVTWSCWNTKRGAQFASWWGETEPWRFVPIITVSQIVKYNFVWYRIKLQRSKKMQIKIVVSKSNSVLSMYFLPIRMVSHWGPGPVSKHTRVQFMGLLWTQAFRAWARFTNASLVEKVVLGTISVYSGIVRMRCGR